MRPHLKHYQVVGRESPSESNANPIVYKFEVFAPNFVVAKSRFWKLMREKKKVKATNGDILSVKVVKDRKIAARNYQVRLAYYCQKVGFTYMTKEYRDVSKSGAVSKAYNDLAGRHRARYPNVEILGVKSIANSECKTAAVKQFHDEKLSFPLVHPIRKLDKKDGIIFATKQGRKVQ